MSNILYVEDDPNSREVVWMALRMDDEVEHNLTIFEDSRDFEERLLRLSPQPDIILLDIHVKPYSGFDMLKMIRTQPQYDCVHIVALTASVMSEEIRLLQEAGFQGAIAKPINLEDFGSLIQRIMNGEHLWYVW